MTQYNKTFLPLPMASQFDGNFEECFDSVNMKFEAVVLEEVEWLLSMSEDSRSNPVIVYSCSTFVWC